MLPRIAITLELTVKGERRTNFLDLGYAECVARAGGIPLHFPSLSANFFKDALALIDGLVLTGGADIHPSYYGESIIAPVVLSPEQRTDFDRALFRAVMETGKPILAICHGMQIMNVALGGSLIQDLPTQSPSSIAHRGDKEYAPARHTVIVESGSRLAVIMGGMNEFEVSSTHHQAVKRTGDGLVITAKAPDGVIEGLEIPAYPQIIGVQWHPEKDPQSEPTVRLFRAFIEMAKERVESS